jgi:lipopolysaccharide export LptBFGC system permease protein LptF
LAGISYFLNGWAVPSIHYEKRNLQAYILDQLERLGSGINRTLLLPDDEGTLWVGAYNGTHLRQVRIDITTSKESNVIPAIREHLPERLPSKVRIFAKEGELEMQPERKSVLLSLRAVQVLVPEAVRGASIANEVFHQTFAITDSVFIPLSFAPKKPGIKDRSNPELARHISRLRREARQVPRELEADLAFASFQDPPPDPSSSDGSALDRSTLDPSAVDSSSGGSLSSTTRLGLRRKIATAETEFYRRLCFTLSCLTFPLVGVPLSLLLNRWSRLVPFFVGNMVVIAMYYPLLMVGVSLGERAIWPLLSMALPNVTLAALGVFFARKVIRQ